MEKEQSYRAPGHTRHAALVMPTAWPWSCPPRGPGHTHRVALAMPAAPPLSFPPSVSGNPDNPSLSC